MIKANIETDHTIYNMKVAFKKPKGTVNFDIDYAFSA